MRSSRSLVLAASSLASALLLAACGGDDGSDTSGDDNTTPVIVEIIEDSGKVNLDDGDVVKVDVGQTIQLAVTSGAHDEIHVHCEPEREFEIAAGDSKTFEFTIVTPGQYEVESHELEVVIVKLQVS